MRTTYSEEEILTSISNIVKENKYSKGDKTILLNIISYYLFGRKLFESLHSSICVVCGESAIKFRKCSSKKYYNMYGLCQNCQDKFERRYHET